MSKYEVLTNENNRLELTIRANKKRLNKVLIRENKGFIPFLDVLMVLAILFNFGAVGLTNMLVMKAEPDKVLLEANPIQAKMNNYELHPDGLSALISFAKQVILWSIIAFIYIYYRKNISSEAGLYGLTLMVFYFAIITYADFINDFGFYIGKLLFI